MNKNLNGCPYDHTGIFFRNQVESSYEIPINISALFNSTRSRLAPISRNRFQRKSSKMIDVQGYLATQKSESSPNIATEWTDIEEMYNKKYVLISIAFYLEE